MTFTRPVDIDSTVKLCVCVSIRRFIAEVDT